MRKPLPTGKQRKVRVCDRVRLPDGLWMVLEADRLARAAEAIWIGRGGSARAVGARAYSIVGGVTVRIPMALWYRFRWDASDTLAGAWQAPKELWDEEVTVISDAHPKGIWVRGARLFRKEGG